MAKFEAEISANVNGFINDLDKAEKKANEFASSSTSLNNKSSQAFNKTSNSINKFSNTTGQASSVAMEFNRVIQDAPYGMIGVANNITQLTDSFGRLKGTTGSTGAALKATFASILTSGNLLALGVAAITSGWTAYTMWSQKAKKGTEELKDESNSFSNVLKKYASDLNSVNKSKIDAQRTSSEEIASLNTLRSVIENDTLSRDKRLKAVESLKSQYPSYFKNISNEQLLLGNSVSLYQKLTKEIIATGVAMASQKAMGVEYENIANSTLRRQKSLEVINKLERENAKLAPKLKEIFPDINLNDIGGFTEWEDSVIGTRSLAQMKAAGGELKIVKKNLEEINKETKLQFKDQQNIADSQNNVKLLNDQVNQSIKEGANITGDYSLAKIEQTKEEKNYRRELTESLAQMGYYDAALGAIGYKYQELSKLAQQAGASAKDLGRIAREELGEKLSLALGQSSNIDPTKNISLSGIFTIDEGAISEQMNVASKIITDKVNSLKTDFSNFTLDIGAMLGEMTISAMSSLGEALASGTNVINAIGKSLVSTLGGIASTVGKQMIALGTAGIALKKLVLNPFLAIAAGAALVALGSYASSAVNKTVNSGGVGSGGYSQSSVSSSVVGGGMNTGPLYNNDRQVVELRLRNTDLVGALNNNQNRNNRLS